MANWWYAKDGRRYGPIASAQLQHLARSGELQPDDLVLQEGSTDWVRASKVRGLFPAADDSSTLTPAPTKLPETHLGTLIAKFGTPEAVFRPSSGQTVAGVIVASGLGIAALALEIAGVDLPTGDLPAWGVGIVMLILGFWIWSLRKWRFLICPLGLIQVHATRTEGAAWAEVTEVVQTRRKKRGVESTRFVTVFGSGPPIMVNPISLRSPDKLFQALVSAAERHSVAVRVEWKDDDEAAAYILAIENQILKERRNVRK